MVDEVEQVKRFSDGWDSLEKGGKEKKGYTTTTFYFCSNSKHLP